MTEARNTSTATRPGKFLPGSLLLLSLISCAVLLVYTQSLTFGLLNGDDFDHVGNNPHLRELSFANLHWIFANANVDYWRPLSFLSHALDYQMWGDDYGGHHLTSVILHGLVALATAFLAALVWSRYASAGGAHGPTALGPWAVWLVAVVAGLVFALHPQHVQSVAWVAERKGLLCALFSVLTITAYLQSHLPGSAAARWRLLTVLLFMLAMMSKPMAISLPFVMIAVDIYPLRRVTRLSDWRSWGGLVAQKWPLLLVSVLVTAFTYLSMRTGNFFNSGDMFPVVERVINANRSLWLYVLRFVAPMQLSPMYPVAVLDNSVSLRNLLPVGGLLLVVSGAVYAFVKGRPQWLAAVLAYLAWLVPVSGIVSAGPQSSADRYAYMPGAMLCVVLAVAFAGWWYRLAGRRSQRLLLAAGLSVWMAWLALTAQQYTGAFRDDQTSTQWVEHYFPTWQPFVNYIAGVRAFREGDLVTAEQQLNFAIRFNQARARARLHLAMVRQLQGAAGIAHELVRAALASASHDPYVVQLSAQVLIQLNRGDEAIPLLKQLIEQFPDTPELVRQLAQAYLGLNDAAQAAALLDRLLERHPDDVASMTLRAVIAQLVGDSEVAARLYERVLTIDPDNGDAKNNLKQLREERAKP